MAGGRSDSITYPQDGGIDNGTPGAIGLSLTGSGFDCGVPNFDRNYTAEYGRNGAGVVSVVTKSGSNDLHGSAFEFLRNTDFDADSYFNNQVGLPRNNIKRNQFGYSRRPDH
jgi:hypothetical protein